jgi:hypothetical protein
MSNDAVVKTKILSPADAPAVSTILEVMFHFPMKAFAPVIIIHSSKGMSGSGWDRWCSARSPPDSLLLAWH